MAVTPRRRLLVFDVEGTLFQTRIRLEGTTLDSTIWQSLARALGPAAERAEVETHKKWHDGAYGSYLDWMKETIQIHQRHGLSRPLFESVIASAAYNPGVVETLQRIDRRRFEIVLVSGGFRELARRAQKDFGIYHAFCACEYFFDEYDKLIAFNLLPCDFSGKIDFINLMLREYNLSSEDWVFVGDGANDIPIARAAPLSLAYRGFSQLNIASTRSVEDFTQIPELIDQLQPKVKTWVIPQQLSPQES